MKSEINDILNPKVKNKSDKVSFLQDLRDIEEKDSSDDFLFSTFITSKQEEDKIKREYKESKKKKKKKDNDDNWLIEIEEICAKPSKKSIRKASDDMFASAGLGKKKKKKNKKAKGELINYKKEFEPEMALYKNLLVEQNKFTNSLQKNYDDLTSTRSSNRGITKQMTDLIENINDARALSMQLVEKNINAKKIIAELSMKQKKEFGAELGSSDNMSDYASSYLKQMLTNRQSIMDMNDVDISDYSEDDMMLEIDNQLEEDRSTDIDKIITYGNITTSIKIYNNDVENYEFVMRDSEGNEITDMDPPLHTSISINKSTNTATDAYGQKYHIEWIYND